MDEAPVDASAPEGVRAVQGAPQATLIAPPVNDEGMARRYICWLGPAMAFAAALVGQIFCVAVTGRGLWMMLGAIGLAAILTPMLTLAADGVLGQLRQAGGVWVGLVLGCLIGRLMGQLAWGEFFEATLVLGAWITAMGGVAMLAGRGLGKLAAGESLAGALVTAMAIAWLGWPVWMSRELKGQEAAAIVSRMTSHHPLFAMNSAVRSSGAWQEAGIAYRHTALGQDVPTNPFPGSWPMIWSHVMLGAVAGAASYGCERRLLQSRP